MYQPAEDSFFFAEFLLDYLKNLKNKNITYLDMGTGSGILAQTAEKAGIPKQNTTCADIDSEAIKTVKKQGFDAIQSNLFQKINKKYDLITFNTPYLPQHKHDKKPDTTGGENGDEITLEFIKQAKYHLNPKGRIFFLISSQTPQDKIKKSNPKLVAQKSLFFEELKILQLS